MRQRQNSCVIGIRSSAPYPPDWRFRLCAGHCCHAQVGIGRYPSRPAPHRIRPGCMTAIFHRDAEAVGSKAAAAKGPVRPPAGRLSFLPRSPIFSCAIAWALCPCPLKKRVPPGHSARFHGTDRNFRPVQPLREYGRLMGSDSHPRIPRLSPPGLKKGWLPSPFTVLPAKIVMIHNFDSAGRRAIPFSATRVSLPSYTLLSGLHWKPACQSSRKRHNLLTLCALLRAPPRGIPGYSLLSGGRQLTGDRDCALVCVPPAQHCIFCLSAFRRPLARVPQGTHAGYSRPFSPMRTFRQLPLPKAGASQNGFHPAYALSCGKAWRNSFSVRLSRCFQALAPGVRRFPGDRHSLTHPKGIVIKPMV